VIEIIVFVALLLEQTAELRKLCCRWCLNYEYMSSVFSSAAMTEQMLVSRNKNIRMPLDVA
jgi:hypothetical protein